MVAFSAPLFYNYAAKYEFSVIPAFVFMGNIGFYSGLFANVFEVARKWLGRLPAGIAVSVIVAQAIFGACSGSSVAACVVIGKSSLPLMRKMKYPDTLAAGVIAGSGTLATLIPPSVTICIYGMIVDESIGKLLIGGIFPGILTAFIYIVMVMIQSRNVPRDVTRYSFKEKVRSSGYLWPAIVLIVSLMYGIYNGICTPTEGGAFGSLVIFMLALFSRKLGWGAIRKSLRSTLVTSCMILFIVVSAVLFTRFLNLSGFSQALTDYVSKLQVAPFYIYLAVVAVYIILGCFVGATGMMVMTLPTFYPLMMSLGYDPIWFGIQVVVLVELALETPPVGINLYATKGLADDLPLEVVIRGTIPFVMRDLMVLGILYVFPQIVTFLPSRI
jgi:tripartite ATP-independent transporter DctM subunit